MNPLVKAPLTVIALAAIVYALLPPAPQDENVQQPYAIDLAIPQQDANFADETARAKALPAGDLAIDSGAPVTEKGAPATPAAADQGEATAADTPSDSAPDATLAEPAGESPMAGDAQVADSAGQAADLAASADQHAPAESAPPTQADVPAVTGLEDRWIEREIEAGDTLAAILNDFGLAPGLIKELSSCGSAAKDMADIHPGQILMLRLDDEGQLEEMRHQRSSISSLHISRNDGGYDCALEEKALETRTHAASGIIDSSLFADGQHAGLSDKVIMSLAELFNWDIDFARELHKGDRFSVIYEASYVDGEKYSDNNIIAAEFVNNGKSFRAIRFETPDGSIDYYAPDGTAKKKAFIKTPVKFSRISSGFTKKRWHPVLKRWRSHKGVDYAAPTGTPIMAAGKGQVTFIGRQQGYGKVIYLQHGDRYTTVYGHLSGFAKGLKKGDSVKQGELIGYVGQTGLATGPHLHYEFRINGKHVDPLSHDLPTAMPLSRQYMAAFKDHASPLVEQLNLLASPRVAETR